MSVKKEPIYFCNKVFPNIPKTFGNNNREIPDCLLVNGKAKHRFLNACPPVWQLNRCTYQTKCLLSKKT